MVMPKGSKHSEATKLKMKLSHLGVKNPDFGSPGEKHPLFGKHHTKEAREKISKNHADFRGDKSSNWNGGRSHDPRGYIKVYKPEHPHAMESGYIFEHRLVMEKFLGRYLTPEEVVHHIDDDKSNNHIENLQLFNNNGEHSRFHMLNGGEEKCQISNQ